MVMLGIFLWALVNLGAGQVAAASLIAATVFLGHNGGVLGFASLPPQNRDPRRRDAPRDAFACRFFAP